MTLIKRRKKLLILLVVVVLIIFVMFTPRFRITYELNRKLLNSNGLKLETSYLLNIKITDYDGRLSGIYAKLELSMEKYDRLKQKCLMSEVTETNKDFTEGSLDGEPRYSYHENEFFRMLSRMDNVKKIYGYESMDLDDYEEILITFTLYGKTSLLGVGTTGETWYMLTKENSGNCYLYICS